jgi:hypothetical protein
MVDGRMPKIRHTTMPLPSTAGIPSLISYEDLMNKNSKNESTLQLNQTNKNLVSTIHSLGAQ